MPKKLKPLKKKLKRMAPEARAKRKKKVVRRKNETNAEWLKRKSEGK